MFRQHAGMADPARIHRNDALVRDDVQHVLEDAQGMSRGFRRRETAERSRRRLLSDERGVQSRLQARWGAIRRA